MGCRKTSENGSSSRSIGRQVRCSKLAVQTGTCEKPKHNPDQVSEKGNVFQTQNLKAKDPIGNKVGFRALGMLCARCNRHGHVMSFCRTEEKTITRHQQYVEPIKPAQLVLLPDEMSRPLPYVSQVH